MGLRNNGDEAGGLWDRNTGGRDGPDDVVCGCAPFMNETNLEADLQRSSRCLPLRAPMPGSGPRLVLAAVNASSWHSDCMARISISIVFESGARIGPGKAKLLESIRDTGSISAAARDMGMDYKRAWTLLDSMNQAFTEPVVSAAPGGARGGGATLTAFGEEVLERYRRIQEQSEALAAGDMKALKRRAKPDAGPKV